MGEAVEAADGARYQARDVGIERPLPSQIPNRSTQRSLVAARGTQRERRKSKSHTIEEDP